MKTKEELETVLNNIESDNYTIDEVENTLIEYNKLTGKDETKENRVYSELKI